jgi:hypothetical protein
MYATQKLYTPNLSNDVFKNSLQTYLGTTDVFQNNILNQVLTNVRVALPNQQELPERVIQSVIDGQQSKVENYEVFKALNDKWIAGSDYVSKTLFEDVMFLDRASRNIGDTIIIDIFDLKDMFSKNSLNMEMSVFTFMSGILIENKFNVMSLPAYVNFYNIQDVDGTTIPQPEGNLDFADNMWGTFLDVDYRNSGPKMICFYAGQPSSHLDLPKGNSRFRDDAFDLRRASDNPLIENQVNKKDWAISNKCVGFNVDAGIRNQNIFYSLNVGMDSGKATSESLQTQLNMVDQANGRNVATQNISLYNLYKQRSYQCQVECLGNALLQPTMYFNLRHVPMFNGPYLITQVNHAISQGSFKTTFTGTRQGIYDLPAIENYLQSINKNLLSKIESIIKSKKTQVDIKPTTDTDKAKFVSQTGDSTSAAENSCSEKLNSAYVYWGDVKKSTTVQLSAKEFANKIKSKTTNEDLQVLIYILCYIQTFQQNQFYGYNNNFINLPLTNNYGTPGSTFFKSKTYSCVSIKTRANEQLSLPIANFDDVDRFLDFMISTLSNNVEKVFGRQTGSGIGIAKYYACLWGGAYETVSESYYDSHLSEFKVLQGKVDEGIKSAGPAGLNVESITQVRKEDKKQKEKIANTYAGITTPPNNLNTTIVPVICVPPTITSFSPLSGISGTIVSIIGKDLDQVTGATINGVTTTTGITINNSFNISVIVPYSNTTVAQNNSIIVLGTHGDSASVVNFTYNPAQVTPVPSNPNNSNTQPQQTGPVTLDGQTQTSPGGVTQQLTVSVNPQAAALNTWTLEQNVTMIISVYDNSVVNNTTTQTLNRTVTTTVSNYVSGNVFTMTYNNVEDMLVNNPIPQFQTAPIKEGQIANIKFTVTAIPTDKVKNPQNVSQSFNFTFRPISSTTQTQPGVLFKVSETYGENLPNFNGTDYYNIKKPTGGYITYQFTCKGLISKGGAEVYSIPSVDKQNIRITNNTDTKYTNVIELNSVGAFQLEVRYTSEDYVVTDTTSSNFGKPINGSATSPPFTL